MRNALNQLVDRGLVIVDRKFRDGTVRLTIQYPPEDDDNSESTEV
ncbi:hypothetical protein [Pseudanabaena sp. PCC 6802]|nr:hypothetical protein [Pseudanabaena sp. PCC 6802]